MVGVDKVSGDVNDNEGQSTADDVDRADGAMDGAEVARRFGEG
jgi:hypothetical protein